MIILAQPHRWKDFTEEQLEDLFLSVGWFSGKFPQKLKNAFHNSGCVISAWNGNMLIGLIRGLNDGVWLATIDCLLINPQYQNRGIASELIRLFLEQHKDFLYVDVIINEQKNAPLYQKFGFEIMGEMLPLRVKNKNWV